MHYACRYSREDIIYYLLSEGVDTTIKNNDGKIALDECHKDTIKNLFAKYNPKRGEDVVFVLHAYILYNKIHKMFTFTLA